MNVSARYGHVDVLSYLCQAGVELDIKDNVSIQYSVQRTLYTRCNVDIYPEKANLQGRHNLSVFSTSKVG